MSNNRTIAPTHRPSGVGQATPLRLQTVHQTEAQHPALTGRLRGWIHKGDAGHPEYIGLRRATVRVGRSLFINQVAFDEWLAQRSAMPPASSRTSNSQAAFAPGRREPVEAS